MCERLKKVKAPRRSGGGPTKAQMAGCAVHLALTLGGKAHHHKAKAARMAEALVHWFGADGVEEFLMGSKPARIEIHRVDWKLYKCRTPNEKAAEVLGFASGKVGPYKGHGRFRPHVLLIRGRRRS